MTVQHRLFAVLLFSAACAVPVRASAGGFYLQEASPTETGRAMAGGAAAGDDPSTVYFNPAAMTNLPGIQFSIGANALMASAHQSNRGSTLNIPSRLIPASSGPVSIPGLPLFVVTPPVSVPISGNSGGNPFPKVAAIPSFYVSGQISDRLWLGLGVNAPFGLKLDYDNGFFGRYDSLYTDLKTYNIQPSAAYKLSDTLSIGGGIDVQYAKVTLTNAVPFGVTDQLARVKGKDWSVGWNAGLFYNGGATHVGVHFRSRISHDLKGTQNISPPSPSPLFLFNISPSVTAPLDLPDIATVSLTRSLTPRLRAMLTARWYNWSVFKRIAITSAVGTSSKELRYHDSYSVSVGGEYDIGPALTLRAGTMFDRTPTNSQFLTTRVPDGDRTWLTGGATWNVSNRLALNLSYAHIFVAKADIIRADNYGGPITVTTVTRSQATGNADQIAASLTARF